MVEINEYMRYIIIDFGVHRSNVITKTTYAFYGFLNDLSILNVIFYTLFNCVQWSAYCHYLMNLTKI